MKRRNKRFANAAQVRGIPVTRIWNFDDPKQAREFLGSLRVGEDQTPVDRVKLKTGEEILLADATDDQAVAFAYQVADWIVAGQKQRGMH